MSSDGNSPCKYCRLLLFNEKETSDNVFLFIDPPFKKYNCSSLAALSNQFSAASATAVVPIRSSVLQLLSLKPEGQPRHLDDATELLFPTQLAEIHDGHGDCLPAFCRRNNAVRIARIRDMRQMRTRGPRHGMRQTLISVYVPSPGNVGTDSRFHGRSQRLGREDGNCL